MDQLEAELQTEFDLLHIIPSSRNIKWMVLYWLLQMLKEIEPWLSSFTCAFCNKEDAVGFVRYHVEMYVSDATNTAISRAFDTEVVCKLTNVPAADVSHQQVGDAQDPTRKRHLEKAFGTVQNHWRNNKECVLMSWRGYTGSWREDKKGDKRAADCIGRS
ncbi:hypothetical protein Bca4012_002643 [Brassica carinata]